MAHWEARATYEDGYEIGCFDISDGLEPLI